VGKPRHHSSFKNPGNPKKRGHENKVGYAARRNSSAAVDQTNVPVMGLRARPGTGEGKALQEKGGEGQERKAQRTALPRKLETAVGSIKKRRGEGAEGNTPGCHPPNNRYNHFRLDREIPGTGTTRKREKQEGKEVQGRASATPQGRRALGPTQTPVPKKECRSRNSPTLWPSSTARKGKTKIRKEVREEPRQSSRCPPPIDAKRAHPNLRQKKSRSAFPSRSPQKAQGSSDDARKNDRRPVLRREENLQSKDSGISNKSQKGGKKELLKLAKTPSESSPRSAPFKEGGRQGTMARTIHIKSWIHLDRGKKTDRK